MSTNSDLDRIVRSWMDEGVTQLPDRVLDAVLDQIPTTRQRRSWWPVRSFPARNQLTRIAMLAAAAVAVVLIGYALTKANVGTHPMPSAGPTPAPPPELGQLPQGNLAAGTYQIDTRFPVRLSFTLPGGFNHGRGNATGVGINYASSGPVRGVFFEVPGNVYPDPCHTTAGPASPPIGASVDDLVTALTHMVGFHSGPITRVTIGGFPAQAFDLSNQIDGTTCSEGSLHTWTYFGSADYNDIGFGELQRIYVLKVSNTRFLVNTWYLPASSGPDAAVEAQLQMIVDSIEIR